MVLPTFRHTAALCVLLGFGAVSCGKKPEGKPKPLKKEAAAAQASGERQALNNISRLLRELAAAPSDPAAPPAARAAAMLAKLQSIPAVTLPDALRGPWQEMGAVLEAAAQSNTPGLTDALRRRGEAAALALNAALAAEGLTDFRF